ncbi:MAG: MopE-related protein, partial [Myxococcales bacterium]
MSFRIPGSAILCLALLVGACHCGTAPSTLVEALKDENAACTADAECVTGACGRLPDHDTAVCLRKCSSGCRDGELCTSLGVDRHVCAPEREGLCQPCETDADCPYPADRCLRLGDEKLCGRDCSFDDKCPDSYRCTEAIGVDGTPVAQQCQPSSGTCACTSASAGQQVPCEISNEHGRCTGQKKCQPPVGYAACTALVPTRESCNGIDDDCDGAIDEDLGATTCGVGACERTVQNCVDGKAVSCTPGESAPELCNGIDDDCDGTVDDGFDLQNDPLHCGACGNACAPANATAGCAAGRCTIASCAPGFHDLDRDPANGCEYGCAVSNGGVELCDGLDNDCDGRVDEDFVLASDPLHCGSCGNVCAAPYAVGDCAGSQCVIGACYAGRGDCNLVYADGCETDTLASLQHCGGCGRACAPANAQPVCAA